MEAKYTSINASTNTRKNYIDNLRSLCILLLFPFHTAMMFIDLDEVFYVSGAKCRAATYFDLITYPWWMSGLFVLAGMSTVFALKRRTGKMYLKERVSKLLIPFISAMFLVVPVQTYIADIFHNGYTGNYFEHFKVFFVLTDFGGYDGHLTPGHTWFILYLFLISLITLPLILWYKKREKKLDCSKLTMPVLLLMFVIPWICSGILDIGGKSLGDFTSCFLLGYFLFSQDKVIEKIEKHAIVLGIAWVALMVVRCVYHDIWADQIFILPQPWLEICNQLLYRVFSWIGILAMLGLGKRFLEFATPVTKAFAAGSFPIYLFHQSVLIIVGFFVLKYVKYTLLQYVLIVILSFIFSMLLYELCKCFKVTRFLFGIKAPKKQQMKKAA